jgi:hypothetical protein
VKFNAGSRERHLGAAHGIQPDGLPRPPVFKSHEHLVIVSAVAALLVVTARASAMPAGGAPSEMPTIARSDDDLPDEEHMLRELIAQSFPALAHIDIRLKGFHSDSTTFELASAHLGSRLA